MRKILFSLIVLASVLLTACGGQNTTAAPTATNAPAAKTNTPVASAPTPRPTPSADCVLTELLPEPSTPIPAITKSDWSKGPENARVTFIEYSDFQ